MNFVPFIPGKPFRQLTGKPLRAAHRAVAGNNNGYFFKVRLTFYHAIIVIPVVPSAKPAQLVVLNMLTFRTVWREAHQ